MSGQDARSAAQTDEQRTVLEVYSRTHTGLVPDAIQAVLASHDALLGCLEEAADWLDADLAHAPDMATAMADRELRAELQEGHPRGARVLMLSGIRRAESERRKSRPPISFHGSIVFCNPLIDWSKAEMDAYRSLHKLPESDVAALLHRSGECNCGSFAAPGERETLRGLWPEWFDNTIASLEREAEERGIRSCRWGERVASAVEDVYVGQLSFDEPLCTDCVVRRAP